MVAAASDSEKPAAKNALKPMPNGTENTLKCAITNSKWQVVNLDSAATAYRCRPTLNTDFSTTSFDLYDLLGPANLPNVLRSVTNFWKTLNDFDNGIGHRGCSSNDLDLNGFAHLLILCIYRNIVFLNDPSIYR